MNKEMSNMSDNEQPYTKEEWLNEKVFVDEYGRDFNMSDVPMTNMPRKEAFKKRGYSEETIDGMWLHFTQYNYEEEIINE
tara:strand:- start:1242 stop:1481 length:240 start_codon:yes stop_codon:yes gene_type:complete